MTRLALASGVFLYACAFVCYDTASAHQIPDLSQERTIAGLRVDEVVARVDVDSVLAEYPLVLDFMAPGDEPFGSVHPDAPAETAQWARLNGVWMMESHALFQDQWWCCWNSAWAWRSILGGMAVQDLYVTRQEDLPPVVQNPTRDASLTQLRVFRPDTGDWFVGYVTSGGAQAPGPVHGTFRAYADGDDAMIMERPKPEDPETPWNRVVFFDITDESFRWISQNSSDGGETWSTTTYLYARRLPVERRSDAIEATLAAQRDRFSQALLEGDTETLAACYTEDGVLLPPDRTVRGREAIARYFAPGRAERLHHAMQPESVRIDGDTAVEHGTWTMTTRAPEATEPNTVSERYVLEWRRGADGQWRIATDAWHRPPR